MRRSKFTESQIVATLTQVEGGRQVKDVGRELGISDATYYVWKSKYGGMEASDVQRSPGSESAYHCCRKWIRSFRSRPTGRRPPPTGSFGQWCDDGA